MRIAVAVMVVCLCTATGRSEEPKAKVEPAKPLTEARVRWNKLAEGVTAVSPLGAVGFIWDENVFPHPTFKGGSENAYGTFAGLLLNFLDAKGNFDYLAKNNLFDTPLRYAPPGGKEFKVDWTLRKLINSLGEDSAYGDHNEAVRKGLKAHAKKIAELAKKGDK
jgi:hypothetical protein